MTSSNGKAINTRRFNEEVLFAAEPTVLVSSQDMGSLKEEAAGNRRKRVRLCAHNEIEDNLHEMFIIHAKDTYVRPHKHRGKIESFHVIEGTVDLVVFDDQGNIERVSQMGDYLSGLPFYHRISEPAFHTLLITSDVLAFHEVTNGPFDRADLIFPPWSPEETEDELVAAYMAQLRRSADLVLSQ